MILRNAQATDAYKFSYFTTTDPPPWVAEVEDWVRQYAFAWYRYPTVEDPALLVGSNDDGFCAVVAHHHYEPGVRYLMVVLLHEDARGSGLGRGLWRAAVRSATNDGAGGAFWMVHEENTGALHLSRELATTEGAPKDGYITFVVE